MNLKRYILLLLLGSCPLFSQTENKTVSLLKKDIKTINISKDSLKKINNYIDTLQSRLWTLERDNNNLNKKLTDKDVDNSYLQDDLDNLILEFKDCEKKISGDISAFSYDVELQTGKYFALLFAVQNYKEGFSNLSPQPLNDAKSLAKVLKEEYGFEVELVLDPTRERIFNLLDAYEEVVSEDDNLLIFYAGHGGMDPDKEDGYWCPSDAVPGKGHNNLSNDDVRGSLKAINSRNTLLIVDACWAGSLTRSSPLPDHINKTIKLQDMYDKKTRLYMSSGDMSTVPNKSLFIEYLVLALKENKDNYLLSQDLFYSFKKELYFELEESGGKVISPQMEPLRNVGHKAGDFIFIRKN